MNPATVSLAFVILGLVFCCTAGGSFVLNIGGTWTPGAPERSLYHYRLLLGLVR